eukprot:3602092-Prymnesium_polylepis.1
MSQVVPGPGDRTAPENALGCLGGCHDLGLAGSSRKRGRQPSTSRIPMTQQRGNTKTPNPLWSALSPSSSLSCRTLASFRPRS